MLSISTLKQEYIDKVLEETGLPFLIYTDTGDFQKAIRSYNTVTEYINGLLTVTGSSMEYAGDQPITSLSTELKFVVRVDDDHEADGSFSKVSEVREKLSQAFSEIPPKFNVTENGKNYTVVVAYNLPATGTREQLPNIGDSFSFSCSVYFAYLQNSVNASDVKISIDGEDINFLAVGLARRPSLVANLFAENTNGEAAVYAESTGFVIDLTMPAFVTVTGGVVSDYILGFSDPNTPHAVVLDYGEGKTIEKTMIFGECSAEGQGIENVRYTLSLVPYATEAITGG